MAHQSDSGSDARKRHWQCIFQRRVEAPHRYPCHGPRCTSRVWPDFSWPAAYCGGSGLQEQQAIRPSSKVAIFIYKAWELGIWHSWVSDVMILGTSHANHMPATSLMCISPRQSRWWFAQVHDHCINLCSRQAFHCLQSKGCDDIAGAELHAREITETQLPEHDGHLQKWIHQNSSVLWRATKHSWCPLCQRPYLGWSRWLHRGRHSSLIPVGAALAQHCRVLSIRLPTEANACTWHAPQYPVSRLCSQLCLDAANGAYSSA